MKRVSALDRENWAAIQMRAPKWARHTLLPVLGTLRDYGILLIRPYVNAYRLSGESQAGPLTVTYAVSGIDASLKAYLGSLAFQAGFREESLGKVPLWRLRQIIRSPASDLTFISANRALARALPDRQAIVLPRFVNQILDVQGDWDSVLSRFHKTVHKNELRLVRKHGYEYEISVEDADFETFFRDMYRPLMDSRHGSQAHRTSFKKAHRYFKQGFLIVVKRQSQFVAGAVCDVGREPGVVHFLLTGVIDADERLIHEGAQSALYYAAAHWANRHGYAAVDFEATEPFLRKGIFQHKRKWGAAAKSQSHRCIWLKAHRHTPAVSAFFENNPLIVLGKQGDLQGLFFADEPERVSAETREAWGKLCEMPGMSGYSIRSVQAWLDGSNRRLSVG